MDLLQRISNYIIENESTSLEKAYINLVYDKEIRIENSDNIYINAWIYGDNTTYNQLITHHSIGQHLRELMPKNLYINLGRFTFNTYDEEQQNEFKIAFKDNFEELIIRLGQREYNKICDGLDSFLNTLPDYTGICYRILELEDNRVYSENIQVNDLISDKSYLATSLFRGSGGKSSWSDFCFTAVVKFILRSNTGKYIHSNITSEKEVLFGRNTIFRVTNIIQKDNKVFYVYAEEIRLPKNNSQVVKNIFTGLKY